MVYGNEEKVKEEKLKIDKMTIAEIIVKCGLLNEERTKVLTKLRQCHSDFVYWSIVGEEEEIDAIKKYAENKIYDYLRENNFSYFKNLEVEKENFKTVLNKINDTIEDLNKYKPSSYKKTIELLKDLASL